MVFSCFCLAEKNIHYLGLLVQNKQRSPGSTSSPTLTLSSGHPSGIRTLGIAQNDTLTVEKLKCLQFPHASLLEASQYFIIFSGSSITDPCFLVPNSFSKIPISFISSFGITKLLQEEPPKLPRGAITYQRRHSYKILLY